MSGLGRCPLWVKSRHLHRNKSCPLCTRKRTMNVEICILSTAKSGAQFKIELVSTSRLRKTGIFKVLARDFRQKFRILRRYRTCQRLDNTEKAPNVQAFSHHFGTSVTRAELGAGAPGFEPGNGGIKIRCLTTWLRPNRYRRAASKPFRVRRADHSGADLPDQRPYFAYIHALTALGPGLD